MKTISTLIVSMLLTVTQAMASGNAGHGEGLGFLAILFIGFGVLILVFQTIPAVLLFAGMLKGLVSPVGNKADESLASKHS
jgi:hypothetical protein